MQAKHMAGEPQPRRRRSRRFVGLVLAVAVATVIGVAGAAILAKAGLNGSGKIQAKPRLAIEAVSALGSDGNTTLDSATANPDGTATLTFAQTGNVEGGWVDVRFMVRRANNANMPMTIDHVSFADNVTEAIITGQGAAVPAFPNQVAVEVRFTMAPTNPDVDEDLVLSADAGIWGTTP